MITKSRSEARAALTSSARTMAKQEIDMPPITKTAEGVFEVWVSRTKSVVNFAKFIEKFALVSPFVMVHYDLSWGIYDANMGLYFIADASSISTELSPRMLELDGRIYNSRPNGILLFENAYLEKSGGAGHEVFRIVGPITV